MQVSVHWEKISAENVGVGDIGTRTVHPPTMPEIVEDEAAICVDVEVDEDDAEEVLDLVVGTRLV